MVTVKIRVEPYVAEYIRAKFTDESCQVVKFPQGLDLYVLIYDLMQKRPPGGCIDRGNLEFMLPDRREGQMAGGKSPEQYNYLSEAAAKVIERKMATMMWAEFHHTVDEDKHLHGINYKDSVLMFIARYGITSLTEEALLKNYQRWRDKLRKRAKRTYVKRKFKNL